MGDIKGALFKVFCLAIVVNGLHLFLIYPYIKSSEEVLNNILIQKAIVLIVAPITTGVLASLLWLPFAGGAKLLSKQIPRVSSFIVGWAVVASIIGVMVSFGDYHSIKERYSASQVSKPAHLLNEPVQSYEGTRSSNIDGSVGYKKHVAPGNVRKRPCQFKPVMTNDDYYACGINPPK